jgi:hypothetical protein
MGKFLPLLSLAGVLLGSLFWSPLARALGGAAMLRGPQPLSDVEAARRTKVVYFWLASFWVAILGALGAWLYSSLPSSRGWFWLVAGVAVVPLIIGVTLARTLRRLATSSEGVRSNKSLERTREG